MKIGANKKPFLVLHEGPGDSLRAVRTSDIQEALDAAAYYNEQLNKPVVSIVLEIAHTNGQLQVGYRCDQRASTLDRPEESL